MRINQRVDVDFIAFETKQIVQANINIFFIFLSIRNLCTCIWFIHILSYILRSCKITFMDGCQGTCMYPTFPLNKMRPRKTGRHWQTTFLKWINNFSYVSNMTLTMLFCLVNMLCTVMQYYARIFKLFSVSLYTYTFVSKRPFSIGTVRRTRHWVD